MQMSSENSRHNIQEKTREKPLVSVHEHYENVLAQHYTWMFGDFHKQLAHYTSIFKQEGLDVSETTKKSQDQEEKCNRPKALDLGCGSGFQTIALARCGYHAVGVDISQTLLEEATTHSCEQNVSDHVTLRHGDIVDKDSFAADGPYNVVVCMGDTLTHLPDFQDVQSMIIAVSECLESGGCFFLSFRDLTEARHGTDRVFTVQSDDDCIMTVFLEYASDQYLTVHDLFHVRSEDGWTLYKSAYNKLRIPPHIVQQQLQRSGFTLSSVHREGELVFIKAVLS